MLQYLRYRYVKAQISAYVNGELNPRARGMVARMIERDERCYAEYRRTVELHAELKRELPQIGKPAPEALGMIWSNIARELASETPPLVGRRSNLKYRLGVAGTAVIALVLLPLMVGTGARAERFVPVQPLPEMLTGVTAPADDGFFMRATPVAYLYETDSLATRGVMFAGLQNTPAPQTPIR
jgi:hypothetical protein